MKGPNYPPASARGAGYTRSQPAWEWPANKVHDSRTCEYCKVLDG